MPQKLYKIKVMPNSKLTKIVEQTPDSLKIKVQAPAYEGKANLALIKFLSLHFKVPKSRIKLLSGEKSREKLVALEL